MGQMSSMMGGGGGGSSPLMSILLGPLAMLMGKGGGGGSQSQAGGAQGTVPRPTPTMGPQMQVPFQAGSPMPFISAGGAGSGGQGGDIQKLLQMLMAGRGGGG